MLNTCINTGPLNPFLQHDATQIAFDYLRRAGEIDDPELQTVLDAADALRVLAAELTTTPTALAIAFALANERVATVLFGATTAEQLAENARAVELLERLTPAELDDLRAIGR